MIMLRSLARLAGSTSPWLLMAVFILANWVTMLACWLRTSLIALSRSLLAANICSQIRAKVSSSVSTWTFRASVAANDVVNAFL